MLINLVLSATLSALPTAERPNVIVFLVDDLGWSDLGCYAQDDFHETPNIDGLAAEGMRFTAAYAACSVCSPSRAALLTGKYPARLKITDWIPGHPTGDKALVPPYMYNSLPLEEVTLAEALHDAGYATFHVGKWHLGMSPKYWPENQGFDVNIAGHRRGSPGSYHYPYAKWSKAMDRSLLNMPPGGRDGDYLTDSLTDHALDLITEAAEREQPFFLYMSYYTVHTPLQGKEELVAKYRAKLAEGDYEGTHNLHYAAMVQSLDESVGRILERLDELVLTEDTLILFTSDNGGISEGKFNGNAPLRAGKGHGYEGGVREPFIVRWPGHVPAGAECATPVCGIDVYPTLLELAGIEARAEHVPDGVSLAPLLADPKAELGRDALYWHYPHYHRGEPVGAVRRGRYKLMEFFDGGRFELYDLASDPGEALDLAADKPDLVAELSAQLRAWRTSVGALPMIPKDQELNPGRLKSAKFWQGANDIKNPPLIEQNAAGQIVLSTFRSAQIFYTVDGSIPGGGLGGRLYQGPIDLPLGGLVRARTYGQVPSDIEERMFGHPSKTWRIHGHLRDAERTRAALAIDGDPETRWHSAATGHPQILDLDFGERLDLRAFTYDPGLQGRKGAALDWALYLSDDGENWGAAIAEGRFRYRRILPLDSQMHEFEKVAAGRYLRFEIRSEVDGGRHATVAEFGVVVR